MNIKGFIDVSFVDWDGKLSSVIFLPNCNFRCPFCHNVNLVLDPKKLETIPIEHVEDQLKKQKDWIDGICITGGEPTIHTDLPVMCSRLKKMGFQIKLDTNGTNPSMLKELITKGFVDFIAMDIKAPLIEKKYSKATGVKTEKILKKVKESIKLLKESKIDYEFRTTVVPTLHNKEDIEQICRSLKNCRKYMLQKFDITIGKTTIDKEFESKSISEDEMQKFLVSAQKIIPNTKRR
jgi:pyruvate formate lyase activating enzyme